MRISTYDYLIFFFMEQITKEKYLQRSKYYVNIILRSNERKGKDQKKQKNLKNFLKIYWLVNIKYATIIFSLKLMKTKILSRN